MELKTQIGKSHIEYMDLNYGVPQYTVSFMR